MILRRVVTTENGPHQLEFNLRGQGASPASATDGNIMVATSSVTDKTT